MAKNVAGELKGWSTRVYENQPLIDHGYLLTEILRRLPPLSSGI
jgi:hypothetical protein